MDQVNRMDQVKAMNVQEFVDFLQQKDLPEDVILTISDNELTGLDFLSLTDEQIKELFPVMGRRLMVLRLLKQAKEVSFKNLTFSRTYAVKKIRIIMQTARNRIMLCNNNYYILSSFFLCVYIKYYR